MEEEQRYARERHGDSLPRWSVPEQLELELDTGDESVPESETETIGLATLNLSQHAKCQPLLSKSQARSRQVLFTSAASASRKAQSNEKHDVSIIKSPL